MKKKSNLFCANQENNYISQHKQNNNTKQVNIDKIIGWIDERPLLQHNLNTFAIDSTVNANKKQINYFKRANVLQSCNQNRISYRRKRKNKEQQKLLQKKGTHTQKTQNQYQCFEEQIKQISIQNQIQSHCQKFKLKHQFSHIQLLKFQVRHLENDQITNNKLPTFSGLNLEYSQNNNIGEDSINLLTNTEIQSMRRKIRTQSGNRRKKQTFLHKNMRKQSIIQINNTKGTPNENNQKFYRTLIHFDTNNQSQKQLINNSFKNNLYALQNPQKFINKANFESLSNNNKQLKLQIASAFTAGQADKLQIRTIHCKKNKPFLKYFQCKKNLNSKRSYSQCQNSKADKSQISLKQIQGRKLYQLLNVNQSLIENEHI